MSFLVDEVTGSDPGVALLLRRHHTLMRDSSPEESCHVMTETELLAAGCRIFACREDGRVLGVGAIKALDRAHAELKSMHTDKDARGRGVARSVLATLLDAARAGGYRRVSLETGAAALFAPARALYAAHDFVTCAPFGEYAPDPLSVFMTRPL